MQQHITILGALYLAFSLLGLLGAVIVFVAIVGGGMLSGDMQAIGITSAVGTTIALFLVIISLPGILAGVGLLKRRPWARILALVLGCLNLLNIPFGTLLGIYTIWVLMNSETTNILSSRS